MRIGQVITLFLPEFVGGATLACARLARALRDRGHQVGVFCGRPDAEALPDSERAWSVDGIPVTGAGAASGYVPLDPRSYRHPEVTPAFERFLVRERPDVLHVHSIQALGAGLLETAAAHGIPVVLTMHDWWWFCARLFLVDAAGFVCPPRVEPARCHCAPGFAFATRRRYLDAMLAHADRILTPSRFLADAVVANGVAAERVEVCPNGVDPPARTGGRRPGPLRFAYFGGPDNRLKGLPTLVRALGEVQAGGWELLLYAVAGKGLAAPATVRDRVETRPPFAPDEIGAVLAGVDILVVPSLMRESYSLVTREALAAGVPVIASDSGGPEEIVRPGTNGLVFATGDPHDLATCMRRVLLAPGLLDRLRAGAAATRVPALATQVDRLEQIYETVAARRSTGRAGARPPGPVVAGPTPSFPAPAAANGGGVSLPPPPGRATAVTPRPSGAPAGPAPARGLRHVLFIAGMDGAPLRYRVTNLREQLALHGIASRALYFTDPALPAAIATADLVVVYRVPMGRYVHDWIAHARRLARPLVFSCDDLVFDPTATPHAALALLPEAERAWWIEATGRYAQALAACDAFLGSTESLVAAAGRLGVPGFVARNGLGAAQLAVAEELRKARWYARHAPGGPGAAGGTGRGAADRDDRQRGETLRLAYASGTTMHDRDFATIEPVLAEVLAERPRMRLRLIGYLRTGPALAALRDRIERVPFLPWHALPAAIATADVNLAPLAMPDPFADAKSEVKYLEAAVLGVPTVATPTAAFRHAIHDGENGRLAASPDEWRLAVEELLADAGLRHRLGNAALRDAFLRYGPATQAAALVAALGRVLDETTGGARDRGPALPASALASPLFAAPPAPADYPGEVGRHDLEPESARPGSAQLSRDTPSPFLLPGRAVGQTFRADADGLSRIDLCVGTDARVHTHRLIVHLSERPGGQVPDLRRVILDAGNLADGAWIAAEFPPLEACAGRLLYVWVEAEGAAPGNAITLWTYTRGWGEEVPGGLHIDHLPVAGSLAFRTFHAQRNGSAEEPRPGDRPLQ